MSPVLSISLPMRDEKGGTGHPSRRMGRASQAREEKSRDGDFSSSWESLSSMYDVFDMEFAYFTRNGEILPVSEAVISISNIEYAYGFGVYETIRVASGKPRYVADHLERLMESARLIGIEHSFTSESIGEDIRALIAKNEIDACNLKLLLIGAPTKDEVTLTIQCLNPHYPDKKLYRDGIDTITYAYERLHPHAKSLNMLESYRAYKKAKEAGTMHS